MMIRYWKTLYEVSKILKSVPEAPRLMIFGPQLSLVTNFTKMLVRQNGNLLRTEPHDFLNLLTKFFVVENKGQLTFLHRTERDFSNAPTNKAFGPAGLVCPGAILTMHYIKSILSFLKRFDIKIEGVAIFEGERFKNIVNKKSVFVTFTKIVTPETIVSEIKDGL